MGKVLGSSVCVVGGAGFLGSHLVNKLLGMDCRVTVVDDFSVGRMKFVPPGVTIRHVNITDPRIDLGRIFADIDYVFNYSSVPYIPDCFVRPIDVVNTNTLGALRVIEAAHNAEVARILQVSSAEVYGNAGVELLENTCSMSPVSTYAISKTAIDHLAHCRFVEAGIPVVILRQFNCVGERETHPYVVPEIIDQIHKAPTYDDNQIDTYDDNQITIHLGANTRRDFLYAGDAVSMAVELLENGECGEAYNLGSEQSITIYDLAETIAAIMVPGCKLEISLDKAKLRPRDIWHLKSNNKKIYGVIKERPTTSLADALRKTVKYYEDNDYTWGF